MIRKYLQSVDNVKSLLEDEILCFTVRNNVVLRVNHISLISAEKKKNGSDCFMLMQVILPVISSR